MERLITKKVEKKALSLLDKLGIDLKVFKTSATLVLDGKQYTLPPHDEKAWFVSYLKNLIEERGINPANIEKLTREAYGCLRYKQVLAGSSDGSTLGSVLALNGHVNRDNAKEVYKNSLKEYDSKRKA